MLHLTRTEQLQPRQIGRLGIPVRIGDVIAAAAGRWHLAFGPALELTVGENCEADPAIDERPRIDRDALLARRRVPRVGMVRGLRAVYHIDPRAGHVVAALLLRAGLRRPSFAPVVALINIMIVG